MSNNRLREYRLQRKGIAVLASAIAIGRFMWSPLQGQHFVLKGMAEWIELLASTTKVVGFIPTLLLV